MITYFNRTVKKIPYYYPNRLLEIDRMLVVM